MGEGGLTPIPRGWVGEPPLPAQPCDGGLSILYLEDARTARITEGFRWQRQLLLQKRKLLRKPQRIFCRSKAPITLNFMSATPNRRRIFTRACSVSKVSPTADRRPASKIVPVTPFVRTNSPSS